jgi:hypothetical protein
MAMASRFTSKRAIKMLAAPQKQFMAVDEDSSAASSSCGGAGVHDGVRTQKVQAIKKGL